ITHTNGVLGFAKRRKRFLELLYRRSTDETCTIENFVPNPPKILSKGTVLTLQIQERYADACLVIGTLLTLPCHQIGFLTVCMFNASCVSIHQATPGDTKHPVSETCAYWTLLPKLA